MCEEFRESLKSIAGREPEVNDCLLFPNILQHELIYNHILWLEGKVEESRSEPDLTAQSLSVMVN